MKLAYKQKLFIYFFIIFAAFTVFIALFQQNREKVYKTEALRGNLNEYADLIDRCIESQQLISTGRIDSLNHLLTLLPRNLRLTVVDFEGKVLFDNSIEAGQPVENHLQRPEVQTALVQTTGSAIRLSATTGIEYYYFAKAYGDFFVRVALPYDIEVQNFLKSDNIFLYFVTLLFFIALVSLLYLSDHLGKAISGLKDFILSADSRQIDYNNIHLPNNELGEIGEKIIQNYLVEASGCDRTVLRIAIKRVRTNPVRRVDVFGILRHGVPQKGISVSGGGSIGAGRWERERGWSNPSSASFFDERS